VTAPSGAAAAYSTTAGAWQRGPGRIYDRLADVVVGSSPVPVAGARALDLGAGTGAASRAVLAAGACAVVAVDAAVGMLAQDASARPPAVVADALGLPFPAATFDVTVAAFSLTHLGDPSAGLREAARVTRAGGAVIASAYADDDVHPVKIAVEDALRARGWKPEPWYEVMRTTGAPKLATAEACRTAAVDAGLHDAEVVAVRVPFAELGAPELVGWRMGLAQHAPFVAALPTDADRAAVVAEAIDRLGTGWPTLERSILVIGAKVGDGDR
jgi:SAM-dependent methyltransferase